MRAIVNYENFHIAPDVLDAYAKEQMAQARGQYVLPSWRLRPRGLIRSAIPTPRRLAKAQREH